MAIHVRKSCRRYGGEPARKRDSHLLAGSSLVGFIASESCLKAEAHCFAFHKHGGGKLQTPVFADFRISADFSLESLRHRLLPDEAPAFGAVVLPLSNKPVPSVQAMPILKPYAHI